jgi:pimeloyl-ACP methyl ester carboxylesterase
MINPKHIGALVSRHIAEVEAGRLRFFALATGQTDPRYVDAAAELRRGDPGLPVPPTFLYCLDMDAPNPRNALVELLDIDIGRVLHGEQSFTYHRMAYAGERLQFETRIADISDGSARHFQNARVASIPGAGHWPHHDRFDLFMPHVRAFLGARM